MLTMIGEIQLKVTPSGFCMKYANFRCSCGNTKLIKIGHVKSGGTSSCGCRRVECGRVKHLRHGLTGQPIWNSWKAMIARCTDTKNIGWKLYGGAGVTVCSEWLSFDAFFADMGGSWAPGLSIDRKNNELGYSKENCRWATPVEQRRNRRDYIAAQKIQEEDL